MYISISSNKKQMCINTDRIVIIEYDKQTDKTSVHFERDMFITTSGKEIYDHLEKLLKEND